MIIAVDLDNTLNDFAGAWLRMINKRHGLSVKYRSLTNYDMEENFPMLKNDQVNEILGSSRFWNAEMKPQPDSVSVLKYLSIFHEVYIVTARPYTHHRDAIMWLKLWFPFIPEHHIIFAQNKEMVRCDVLIDDCPANLVRDDCKTIQYVQPWNDERVWGTIACESWREILSVFMRTEGFGKESFGWV